MTKLKKTFQKSTPPHWRAHHSSGTRFLLLSLGLAPVFILGFVSRFTEVSRLLFFSIISGLLFDYLSAFIFRRKPYFDSYTLLTSLLFSILIPFDAPLLIIVLGMFFAVFVGKECFGGWGNFVFHPALLACASVFIFLPESVAFFREAEIKSSSFYQYLIQSHAANTSEISVFAVLVGGIYLIWQRLISWKAPAFFILTMWVLSYLVGQGGAKAILCGEVLMVAFFVMPDSTSPIGFFGKILFSIGTAALTVWMNSWLTMAEAVAFAVLMMNAITPLIDRYPLVRLAQVKQ